MKKIVTAQRKGYEDYSKRVLKEQRDSPNYDANIGIHPGGFGTLSASFYEALMTVDHQVDGPLTKAKLELDNAIQSLEGSDANSAHQSISQARSYLESSINEFNRIMNQYEQEAKASQV